MLWFTRFNQVIWCETCLTHPPYNMWTAARLQKGVTQPADPCALAGQQCYIKGKPCAILLKPLHYLSNTENWIRIVAPNVATVQWGCWRSHPVVNCSTGCCSEAAAGWCRLFRDVLMEKLFVVWATTLGSDSQVETVVFLDKGEQCETKLKGGVGC